MGGEELAVKKNARPKMDPFAGQFRSFYFLRLSLADWLVRRKGYDTPKSTKTNKSSESKQGKRKGAKTNEGTTVDAPTPPKRVKAKK